MRAPVEASTSGAGTEPPLAATALLHRLVDVHLHRPLKSRAFLASIMASPVEPKTPTG